jgi:hypothetical protein
MKKISLILAVLLMTAPAAAVTITCTGNGLECTVEYSFSGEPNSVRAFALDIVVDNGAIITDVNDDVNPDYNIYPGSIVIVDGSVTEDGNAVADPCDYPSDTQPGVGSSGITVEMGALYSPPIDPCGPPPGGVLLKFTVDTDCNVTITQNSARGGVVLTDPTQDPSSFVSEGCQLFDEPPCWSYDCFECGDGNGDCNVTFADMMLVINAWDPNPYDPCADFNKDGSVTFGDVMIIINHWAPKEACPAAEGCSPCTPI